MLLTTLFLLITLPFWLVGMSVISVIQLFFSAPVLFCQRRLGRYGKPFLIYKFATLDDTGEPISAWHNWLRKTHLDELPQWINMMKGDMVLVGPRPLPERYFDRMSDRVKQRFEVKPGLTGLAQVHEHDEITWEERFAYDVLYVHRKKLMLDVIIAGKTVVRIVKELGNNEPKKQITEYMRE